MTRTDNKPLFCNRSTARFVHAVGSAALGPHSRPQAQRVFRRQVPLLGRFIADFFAPAERLVIEVDGGHHAEQSLADARRDAVLARAGYRVLRLDAALVMRDIDVAVALVRAAL